MNTLTGIWQRIAPSTPLELDQRSLVIILAITGIIVLVGPLWRVARLAVTLVHELGHAVIGVLCGRQFTGLVLRWDASGHTITRGKQYGLGRVLTTWAGYPAPAIVGASTITAVAHGWAAPMMALTLLVILGALIRSRSLLTAAFTLTTFLTLGALWWSGDADWQGYLLLVAGSVSLIGAWRHLVPLWTASPRSDPSVLASLTKVPTVVWNMSFILVCAGSTWLAVTQYHALWSS